MHILAVIPATSRCSAERFFSALHRLKTYLRSTMGQQRVSNIALINIEKAYANSVVNNDMSRDVKYIWNNSYLNCGCRWKWRMVIAVNFQFEQLERRSLKKSGLQRDSNPWPPRYQCDALPLSYEATHCERRQFIGQFIDLALNVPNAS